MIQILVFAYWLISTSKGGGLKYGDLVNNVKDTYDECLAMVDNARDHVNKVGLLGDVRRRNGANAVQLEACVSMLKATDTYRGNLGRLLGAPEFVRWKDIGELDNFLKPVNKKLGKIPLYIASKDGDSADDFHRKCDDKGPTVVIIQTTTGNVFGGYTDHTWASSSGGYRNAPNSFLFRLRPSIGKYACKTGVRNAIFTSAGYGPTFGSGHDLLLRDRAFTRTDSYVYGHDYTATRYTLNDGIRNFQVEEYAVFPAISL